MTYKCDPCGYITDDKSHYNRHLKSRKHIVKNEQYKKASSKCSKLEHYSSKNEQNKNNKCKESNSKSFKCDYCTKIFSKKFNLLRHQETCTIKKVKDIKDEFKKEIDELKEKLNKTQSGTTITGDNTRVYNISVKTCLDQSYQDAPELLPFDDYSVIEKNEDDFIDNLYYNYTHNMLHKYLGNIIIKYYKKDDHTAQSLWNSDTHRLKYIVRELMANKEAIWSKDPKGIKTKKSIVDPLLTYIKKYIKEYTTKITNNKINMRTKDLANIHKKLVELQKVIIDIDNDILAEDIIKYIAPFFSFSKIDSNAKMLKR